MDSKLEHMLRCELQPAVKIKRFEYTPMTPKEKEAVNNYIVTIENNGRRTS